MNKSIYSVLFKLGELLKPFVIAPLIIKQFGLSSFADYALMMTIVAISYPIIDAGILSYSQRAFYRCNLTNLKKISDLIKAQLLFSPVALVISSGMFFWFFSEFQLAIICSIYLYLFAITNSFNGYLRARDKFATLVKLKIFFDVVEVITIVVFLYTHKEFSLYVFGYMAIVRGFYFSFQVKSLFKNKLIIFVSKLDSSELIVFFKSSLILVPIAVIGGLSGNIERFFIDDMLGKEQLGIYVVLLQYVYYLKLVVFPITFTQLPILSKLYDLDGVEVLKVHIKKILLISLTISIVATVFFWCFRFLLFETIVGVSLNNYREATLIIFLVAVCVMNINSILILALTVTGQLSSYLYVNVMLLILSVIINLIYLTTYSYMLSASIILLNSIISLIFSTYKCRKIIF